MVRKYAANSDLTEIVHTRHTSVTVRRMVKVTPRKDPKDKKKAGQPPIQYDPNRYPQYARALAMEGLTNEQIAERMGMTKRTLQNWRRDYPEFSAAIKIGKEESDSQVEMSLFKRAMGYTITEEKTIINPDGSTRIETVEKEVAPDTTAQIFWLKNRQRQKWMDVNRTEMTGPNGNPIAVKILKGVSLEDLK